MKKLEGRDLIREKVRERDNHTCQICGKIWVTGQRRFDVHHLDVEFEGLDRMYKGTKRPKGQYAIDKANMGRMVTYCHKCHLNLPHLRKKMSAPRPRQKVNPQLSV